MAFSPPSANAFAVADVRTFSYIALITAGLGSGLCGCRFGEVVMNASDCCRELCWAWRLALILGYASAVLQEDPR